jgi:hypothetical protein
VFQGAIIIRSKCFILQYLRSVYYSILNILQYKGNPTDILLTVYLEFDVTLLNIINNKPFC